MMGGQIGLVSAQGKGSTFWFTVVQQKVKGQEDLEVTPLNGFEGVNILVVDDNATNRMVVGTVLKSWGCRLTCAADGDSALAAMREAIRLADPFEVALLDLEMPGMDGEELGRQMAADSQLAHTARLMMRTRPRHGQPDRGFEEGEGESCITKPVVESRLRETLNGALGRRTPPNGLARGKSWKRFSRTPARAGARILLAEDISSNREVALGFLTKLGYHSDLVNNGAEALAAVQSVPYDLLLMDCEMPEMDGYEASRRIRKQETSAGKARIPIVALTAHAISGDKAKCVEAGMDDYLSKPIQLQALAEMLAKFFPPSAPPGERKVLGNPRPEPAHGVFDEKELLGRLIGNRSLAGKVVAKFLQDAPALLHQLRERLEAGDAAETRRRAHGLKGAASTVSAGDFRDVALSIEDAALVGDLASASHLLPRLDKEFEQLRTFLLTAGWAEASVAAGSCRHPPERNNGK
jgi:CheY-like chemotaxis protein/HPt (histidine-containing phosphotransfer) domain-containing protein